LDSPVKQSQEGCDPVRNTESHPEFAALLSYRQLAASSYFVNEPPKPIALALKST
jgi:hypothetical protein